MTNGTLISTLLEDPAKLLDLLIALGVGALAVLGTFIGARMHKKGQREVAIIDQLQENVDYLTNEVKALRQESTQNYRNVREWKEYAYDLRAHIAAGSPPPPPSIPTHLQN